MSNLKNNSIEWEVKGLVQQIIYWKLKKKKKRIKFGQMMTKREKKTC